MKNIEELDKLVTLVGGFPRPWTASYRGQRVRLSGVDVITKPEAEQWILVYPDDGQPFDHKKYIKLPVLDPEFPAIVREMKHQMLAYYEEQQKHKTAPLGE